MFQALQKILPALRTGAVNRAVGDGVLQWSAAEQMPLGYAVPSVGEDDPVRPRLARPVGRGPRAPPERMCLLRRDTWVPPYKSFRRGRCPHRPASVARGAVRNPPVTASPCQPPLGKGAKGTGVRIATASVRTGFAMTGFFIGGAVQDRAGRPGGRPLRMRCKGRGTAGRCGERTERCQWQRKRGERVAAVKISSVRRKAAQKFWAPQQDHRPLRRSRKFCRQRAGHLFSVCTQILLCACYNEHMCFYSFP